MKKQNILHFWRDIEIFNLPDFNKKAFPLDKNKPFPWEVERETKEGKKWIYTLIFGKIPKRKIINHITNSLESNAINSWEEPVNGHSCISALVLNEEGTPNKKSYALASYISGIKHLKDKEDLSKVADYLSKNQENHEERYNSFNKEDSSSEGKVTWEYIQSEIAFLKKKTPWLEDDINVYLLEKQIPKNDEPDAYFLNSFYLDDLNRLLSDNSNYSETLKQYLTLSEDNENRKDLVLKKDLLLETINPENMSSGKWASSPEYGLYTAQLGAVNTIFSELRNSSGIQGVNGPPGTGKTTLLLDVVAEVIVERAKVISDLGCNGIFEIKGYNKIDKEKGGYINIYNLNQQLRNNFGIVVASNNNSAVENISKELPSKGKIEEKYFPEANYFAECSQDLINEESWGILAGALGNTKNKNSFKYNFWDSGKDEETYKFKSFLESHLNKDAEKENRRAFEKSSNDFHSLLREFEEFKEIASSFHSKLSKFKKYKEEERKLNKKLRKINQELSTHTEEIDKLGKKIKELKEKVNHIQLGIQLLSKQKPFFFFFHKLFSSKKFKEWNKEQEHLYSKYKSLSSQIENYDKELTKKEKEKLNIIKHLEDINRQLSKISNFFISYYKEKDTLIKKDGKYTIKKENLCDLEFQNKGLDEIHLLNPYHSKKIAILRSCIFLKALELHKYAILVNAKKIRHNLISFFDLISGQVKVAKDLSSNLWDSLFLSVPVVSTSLASASRLFPNLDTNQIGWLLIDEAGQATPQSAAGIIQRSKRCVIVGDPLQVEPVVTIPQKLVTDLRTNKNVDVCWSPHATSVQKLADRISIFGTYMGNDNVEEKIWTGFPLRTHRRCENPMFKIANEIAYSNQMVKAIKEDTKDGFIGNSCWFNIEGTSITNDHVVKEEIELLKQKIAKLKTTNYEGDIYVISPFKSVANYCSNVFRKDKKVSSGTIHKFQGKEADVVFIVLGSDPQSPGARNWASKYPNMLNVALTRAKKRCYVIGNQKLWGECSYFDTMLEILNQ